MNIELNSTVSEACAVCPAHNSAQLLKLGVDMEDYSV